MIDAAIQAGVQRLIPTEYDNNTCSAAAELVTLYEDKAKVAAYLKSKESAGLIWSIIHTGQFFDWGLESGWLEYHLDEKRVTICYSGDKLWSITNIGSAGLAVAKAFLKPNQTKNKPLFVASPIVFQRQVSQSIENSTGTTWKVETMSSADALKKAAVLDDKDYSDDLKLLILMLLCARLKYLIEYSIKFETTL